MSEINTTLNASDFAGHTVIDLSAIKVAPIDIARTAIEVAIGGVGHVLVHRHADGSTTWTPTARDFGANDPGQPQGFPEVLAGYGRTMTDVIDKWRYFASIEWRDAGPVTTGQALVFDSADDAQAFLATIAEVRP